MKPLSASILCSNYQGIPAAGPRRPSVCLTAYSAEGLTAGSCEQVSTCLSAPGHTEPTLRGRPEPSALGEGGPARRFQPNSVTIQQSFSISLTRGPARAGRERLFLEQLPARFPIGEHLSAGGWGEEHPVDTSLPQLAKTEAWRAVQRAMGFSGRQPQSRKVAACRPQSYDEGRGVGPGVGSGDHTELPASEHQKPPSLGDGKREASGRISAPTLGNKTRACLNLLEPWFPHVQPGNNVCRPLPPGPLYLFIAPALIKLRSQARPEGGGQKKSTRSLVSLGTRHLAAPVPQRHRFVEKLCKRVKMPNHWHH